MYLSIGQMRRIIKALSGDASTAQRLGARLALMKMLEDTKESSDV